jgi:glycosyltransferase involved in cell wall biosynthesis
MNIVHYFYPAQDVHLGKDICQFLDYLAKQANNHCSLVCKDVGQKFPNAEEMAPNLQILKLKSPRIWLLKNFRKINCLIINHNSTRHKFLFLLYKIINPKSCAYLRMDTSSIKTKKINIFVCNFFFRFVDVIHIESSSVEQKLRAIYHKYREKIHLIPNPIKSAWLTKNGFDNILASSKENLIITVAKIGTEQKNNEMMLNALNKLDMKDWKFVFIGGIEKKFRSRIGEFFVNNPNLKNNVIFTDEISDKKELYEWYRKAKIFCLTSRFETTNQSQLDAIYFGCFNISTPVSGTEDLFDNWKFGIKIENVDELKDVLQKIFNGQIDSMEKFESIKEYAKNFYLPAICEKVGNAINKAREKNNV